MHARFGWWVAIAVATAFAIGVGWKVSARAALQGEVDREIAAAKSLEAVRAKHTRLLAAHPPAEAAGPRSNILAAVTNARSEVTALQQQMDQIVATLKEQRSAPEERFAVGRTHVAADWCNAGISTPQATLETALWAGAGGDVDSFAKILVLSDGRTREAAQVLWQSVSGEIRAQYGSPEQLIAFFAIRDVPLGSAQVRQVSSLDDWPAPAARIVVLLRRADGQAKDTSLLFMNPGDGWKLVVTQGVVERYAAKLR